MKFIGKKKILFCKGLTNIDHWPHWIWSTKLHHQCRNTRRRKGSRRRKHTPPFLLRVFPLLLCLLLDLRLSSFSATCRICHRTFLKRMSRHPEVLWAQRSDKVYLTIALPDAKDVSVKCEAEGVFSFSAVGVQGESFDFTLQLYGAILPEGCKTNVGLRNIICSVQKQEKAWWKRLLKSEEKPAPYIKVDWNKWCDEDDEETTSDLDSDDDNTAYDEEDEGSDDEGMLYLPDLEKARGN